MPSTTRIEVICALLVASFFTVPSRPNSVTNPCLPFNMNALRLNFPKLARGMASASSVQAPLQLHSLDGRYATALFTAASKANSLKEVEGDMKKFQEAYKKDAAFRSFLESPVVDEAQKTDAIKVIADKQNFNNTTLNFFQVLGANGRMDLTGKVLDNFHSLMAAHRGEVPVVVTSATELDSKTLGRIKDALSKGSFIKSGQTLVVSNKVNPSILAGIIVEVGDNTIDMSTSTRVTKIQQALTGAC